MTALAATLIDHEEDAGLARWTLAAAVVLAAHVGVAASYFLLHAPQPQGSPQAPAVMLELAPLPEALESPRDVEPAPQMVEAPPVPEPLVETPPEPELVEPPPPEQQVVELVPPPPQPVAEPLPPPPPPVETPVVIAPEPPPPLPPPPEVKPEPTPEKPPVRVEQKKPRPRNAAPPRAERRTSERVAAHSPGAANPSTAIASWRDLVLSQLQRAKRYPRGAESRRETGTVTLSFTLSRGGGVLSRSIARSSGNPEFDQEALAMVQRAAPFPPFPAGMSQASVHLSVPIRFSLR